MYKMRKIAALVLVIVLMITLAACGGESVGTTARPVSLTGEIGGEIAISCYESGIYKAFLEDAARLFEEKYPGTKVNVETFSVIPTTKEEAIAMDDTQERHDYISRISTSLMSGDGADIFAMDILPAYKYINAGQLENLAAYMAGDPEFNTADYRENIINAVRYKDGIWFLPLNYTFEYYSYAPELLPETATGDFGDTAAFTAEGLISLAEPGFDGSAKMFDQFDYINPRVFSMWNMLLSENITSLVDLENKSASFDDGRFAALLENVRSYGEHGYAFTGWKGLDQMDYAPKDEFIFKRNRPRDLYALAAEKLVNREVLTGGGKSDTPSYEKVAGIMANADGSVPFYYEQAFGINAYSKNKETAWAFLRFLLSEEMQSVANMRPDMMPLHNAAREKTTELRLDNMFGRGEISLDELPAEAVAEAVAGLNETVERFSGLINTYEFEDTIIGDMIAAEAAYFFDGSKTADEIARMLQSKVTLYLNE